MKHIVSPATGISPLPALASAPCFALLDDAHGESAVSRLYTELSEILLCADAAAWPAFLSAAQVALEAGLHAVALFSYETGAQLQAIMPREEAALPSRILLFKRCDKLDQAQLSLWLDAQEAQPVAGIAALRASVDERQFSEAIAAVRDYIAAGDTYQVNYTYRLHFDAYGSPIALYRRLRQRQPVPYGALICLPDGAAVLSLSPELFVRHQAGRLLARPMKGTAAASGDDARDQILSADLASDSKNRAENLMIVDLLRNDIARISQVGSVRVPELYAVEPFATVHQMSSKVVGQLVGTPGLAGLMAALFPCGSITGAPKIRAMEIIHEVESGQRGMYCGAIGWMAPDGASSFNVAIRTLSVFAGGAIELNVGGGVVQDSTPDGEWEEALWKARYVQGLVRQG